jgi:hypothetical protein
VVEILDGKYEKADIPAIVRKDCSHLKASDREKLLSILLRFESDVSHLERDCTNVLLAHLTKVKC